MGITGPGGLLPGELLATWEAGLGQHGGGRALLLHRAARPETSDGELLSVPLGERDADLFALRRALFGERLQVRIDCGRCGEAMEFDLDTDELLAQQPQWEGPLRVAADGWVVEFRLPTVADVAAAARAAAEAGADPAPEEDAGAGADAQTGPALARRLLLRRCTVSAVHAGRPVDDGVALPEPVQRRLADAVQAADPAAEVTLKIACPECGEATEADLDIASYLWTELDSWARDQLLDVHLLAGAYGWSEQEILALSPLRRRYYLELCADA